MAAGSRTSAAARGYFTAAFRDRGAQCLLVEPDAAELYSNGTPGRASVIGDGYWLPLADASVDVCFSCNVLEHVQGPGRASSTR